MLSQLLEILLFQFILFLCADSVFWFFIPSYAIFTYRKGTADNQKLFVCLPGMLADVQSQSRPFTDILLKNGSILLVNYSGDRFESEVIVAETVDWIRRYKKIVNSQAEIVFVGTSMGGAMSVEIYRSLTQHGFKSKFQFILIDCPTDINDLKKPLNFAVRPVLLIRPGSISNRVKIAGTLGCKNSFACDQLRYICKTKDIPDGLLSDLNVIFVKSINDDLVSQTSIKSWKAIAGENMPVIHVASIHSGYNEYPEIWRSVFEYDILPLLK